MLRTGAAPWWPAVQVADVTIGMPQARPVALTLLVRSPLGYRLRTRLTVTRWQAGRAVAADSRGDLRGHGSIRLRAACDGSVLDVHWEVATTRRWMNLSAPLLRPVFVAAHRRVMRAGEAGLRAAVSRGSDPRNAGNPAEPPGAASRPR